MLIYIVADVGAIAGGWLSGRFMNRGWTVNRARKTTLFICSLMVVPVFYSALTDNKWVAAILITLAASGHQAWSSNVFSLAGDMFPKRIVGSLTGFGGLCSTICQHGLALCDRKGFEIHRQLSSDLYPGQRGVSCWPWPRASAGAETRSRGTG